MAFRQEFEQLGGNFYLGQPVEATPTNSEDIFVIEIDVLPGIIPPETVIVNATTTNPLVFPAPADAELVVGLTINGTYTENFVYDRVAGTITVEL